MYIITMTSGRELNINAGRGERHHRDANNASPNEQAEGGSDSGEELIFVKNLLVMPLDGR